MTGLATLPARPAEELAGVHVVHAPPGRSCPLSEWSGCADLAARCRAHPVVLMRGFAVGGATGLARSAAAAGFAAMPSYGDLPAPDPRALGVRPATPYPSQLPILFHNEGAHTTAPPDHLWFHAETPASVGGATPLVDGALALRRLPDPVRQAFTDTGLRYLRTFVPGLDVTWQQWFGTDDPAEAEARCRATGMRYRWDSGSTLQVSCDRPAVVTHPSDGRAVFFNQVLLHHPAMLDPETRTALLALLGPTGLPRSVRWADGRPIPDDVVHTVLEVQTTSAIAFAWQPDDVLVLDNRSHAHGRAPYTGPRRMNVVPGTFEGGPR